MDRASMCVTLEQPQYTYMKLVGSSLLRLGRRARGSPRGWVEHLVLRLARRVQPSVDGLFESTMLCGIGNQKFFDWQTQVDVRTALLALSRASSLAANLDASLAYGQEIKCHLHLPLVNIHAMEMEQPFFAFTRRQKTHNCRIIPLRANGHRRGQEVESVLRVGKICTRWKRRGVHDDESHLQGMRIPFPPAHHGRVSDDDRSSRNAHIHGRSL